jgi:hypothetical protein
VPAHPPEILAFGQDDHSTVILSEAQDLVPAQ